MVPYIEPARQIIDPVLLSLSLTDELVPLTGQYSLKFWSDQSCRAKAGRGVRCAAAKSTPGSSLICVCGDAPKATRSGHSRDDDRARGR
jgi:hypothetical protein